MKTTINRDELIEFDACKDGLELFVKAHGDKTVNLSQCFDSNSLDDVFWLLEEFNDRNLLSEEQLRDLRLFAADCAKSALHVFENEHPDDNRPRLAIQKARDYANGLIDENEMRKARSAAWPAAKSAVWSADSVAAWSAANSKHERALKSIFLKWEKLEQNSQR